MAACLAARSCFDSQTRVYLKERVFAKNRLLVKNNSRQQLHNFFQAAARFLDQQIIRDPLFSTFFER